MSVINDLIAAVKQSTKDVPVQDVFIGLHWTAVTSRETGLAATSSDAPCCYARDIEGTGKLHERSAFELVDLLFSKHPLETSVGMAALNSLIKINLADGVELNAKDLMLEHSHNKRVAVIGHFPFAEGLKKTAAQLWILELDPAPGEYPASAADKILPQADIIGLTASTLFNGTFDALHKLFPEKALVVMMGPSTPLTPVLYDHGIDVLAGSYVTDPKALYRYVSQGTTMHKVEGLSRLTILKDNALSKLER